MTTQVTMPRLGESIVEGTVGKWLVNEGDRVEKDQPVVEILTDKADSEVPATTSGVVTKLLVQEGAVVAVGQALLEIDANATASASPAKTETKKAAKVESAPKSAPAAVAATPVATSNGNGQPIVASPAVRKVARERGVDVNAALGALGRGGVSGAAAAPVASGPAGRPLAFKVPPYVELPGDEIIPFTRRRRIIADHMVLSKQTSPHVMAVAECDLYKTSALRDKLKDSLKKEGINLTFLAFVAAATAKCLRQFRELNARVLDDAYVLHRDVNLGIAVDTPEGLVVPVIRNADELTLRGLARSIDELALKAREGKLTPDDLASKTFTISNPGKKGNLFGAAIISQPNVGILRIGEIQKRVVVVEHEGNDVMAIHPVMYVSLSYDHRIVDGVHANGFLHTIVELLESGDFEI